MHSASSRIWTRVTVSISYDDNHYTTGTSLSLSLSLSLCIYIYIILSAQSDGVVEYTDAERWDQIELFDI